MALKKPLRGVNNKAYNDWHCSLFVFLGHLCGVPEWEKKDYSVNINIWFTPPHDSACSWNKHPTACLWFLMMYCTHCSPTGCLAARVALVCDWLVFSWFFSRRLKSQSQVSFCPLLFLHRYWSWIYILCSQCSCSTSKWQCWLLSYQDALHYIWYIKHYWSAQKESSKALNMRM